MRAGSRTWLPPALAPAQQADLKAAVQAAPHAAGIELANWNWKIVRQFVQERFDRVSSRSSCINYLYRLGFVVKRPKKRQQRCRPELQAQADALAAAANRRPAMDKVKLSR